MQFEPQSNPTESLATPTPHETTVTPPSAAKHDAGRAGASSEAEDAHARLERLLRRVVLEGRQPESLHREFSVFQWLAAIAEIVALLFIVLAMMDWFADAPLGRIINRSFFAMFFQVAALTAVVAGKRRQD